MERRRPSGVVAMPRKASANPGQPAREDQSNRRNELELDKLNNVTRARGLRFRIKASHH